MAIYKNKEVSFVRPRPVEFYDLTVTYPDGSAERASISQIRFTQEEKDELVKNYTGYFTDLPVVTEDDLKAVRIGIAPSYDPSYKEKAEAEALAKKQAEEHKKFEDAAKAEADKAVAKKVENKTEVKK